MDATTVGRVTTEATIENLFDLWDQKRGRLAAADVRRVTISDALVATGATLLLLPAKLIRELGLSQTATKRVTSSVGLTEAAVYDPVWLTIQGRSCTVEVMEVPADVPVIVGQIPLDLLDLVVDLRGRTLIGNPAHGGEHMYEL